MKYLFSLLLVGLLFRQGWSLERTDSIPAEIVGNWINPVSQEWEYGFFEKFAIFRSEFWDYKIIKEKGKQLQIVLEKEGREVELRLQQKVGKSLLISRGKKKGREYHQYQNVFLPYRSPDTLAFEEPQLVLDSVLIQGYYRNLDKIGPEYKGTWGNHEVEVSYGDLLDLDEIRLKTPIDSLGRFHLKIPVYAPQRIYLDWGKLWKSMVVVPGDTVMLYLDMTEFEPRGEEKNNRTVYWKRPKDILFMGEYARLNRELLSCPPLFYMRDMYDLREIAGSDMEYLRLAEADYLSCMKDFTDFYRQYPTLSRRCVQAVTNEVRYNFGATLMQNRFNTGKKHASGFDNPAYMEYVNRYFSMDSVLYYFLTSRYKTFIRDYTDYFDQLTYEYVEGVGMCRDVYDHYADALKQLLVSGALKVPERQELTEYVALVDSVVHGKYASTQPLSPQRIKDSCLLLKYSYLREEPVVENRMERLKKAKELLLFDTLKSCPALKEILIATNFAKGILHDRIDLPAEVLSLLEEKVMLETVRKPVIELNQYYRKLSEKAIKYPQSLINTQYLETFEDSDSLWQALLSPYRGKVIYLDFWGTWCGPCKEMMKLVTPIEHAYEDKGIIFMYFAYASSKESWMNVIKEYDSSGKNIVHYNLSPQQQEKILKMWKVNSFPTFMLIDRQGNVVDRQAPLPHQEKELKAAINKLL